MHFLEFNTNCIDPVKSPVIVNRAHLLSNVIFSFVVGLYLTLIVFIEIQQNTCIVQ